MQFVPLHHMPSGAIWKSTFHDRSAYVNDYLILPVLRVKVGRNMIIPVHGDDNSKESTDNRHFVIYALSSPLNDTAKLLGYPDKFESPEISCVYSACWFA